MMKKAAFAAWFWLIGGVALASAQGALPVNMREVAVSSAACVTITVASHTATEVLAAAGVGMSSGFWAIETYNTDATNKVNCGFDATVSTQVAHGSYGREVMPKTGILWQGLFDTRFLSVLYCKAGGTDATNRLTVCRFK